MYIATRRTLSVRSQAIAERMGHPILEPVRLSGRESVNGLFEYELLLKTPETLFPHGSTASGAADLNLDDFLGHEIQCRVELEGAGDSREINALIAKADFWGEEGRQLQYRLVLRPWLHLADLQVNCRFFQNMTVVQVLDELLGAYPFSMDKRLYERYPVRDFQAQYNESDFAFFERLPSATPRGRNRSATRSRHWATAPGTNSSPAAGPKAASPSWR